VSGASVSGHWPTSCDCLALLFVLSILPISAQFYRLSTVSISARLQTALFLCVYFVYFPRAMEGVLAVRLDSPFLRCRMCAEPGVTSYDALHYMYYSFARVHRTLGKTPAMAAEVADHV